MSTKPRVTMVVLDLLDAVMSAPADDPPWGARLCEQVGHQSGAVFPSLRRMREAGWLEAQWEEPRPVDRPPRRYYTVTDEGRTVYEQAVAAHEARRAAWREP